MRRRAFTLIELLVVISIIAILASLLVPAIRTARQRALTAHCIANWRQYGFGILGYATDHDDDFPPLYAGSSPYGQRWLDVITPNMGVVPRAGRLLYDVVRCPLIPRLIQDSSTYSFGMNGLLLEEGVFSTAPDSLSRRKRVTALDAPTAAILLADTIVKNETLWFHPYGSGTFILVPEGYNRFAYGGFGRPDPRHLGKVNLLYADGHVVTGAPPVNDTEPDDRLAWHGIP